MINHKISPKFKYTIFHIFICILHLLRVYYKHTMWPAPRRLDTSVGRALHWYHRVHGFESHSGFNITTTWVVCITVMFNQKFIWYSFLKLNHIAKCMRPYKIKYCSILYCCLATQFTNTCSTHSVMIIRYRFCYAEHAASSKAVRLVQ